MEILTQDLDTCGFVQGYVYLPCVHVQYIISFCLSTADV